MVPRVTQTLHTAGMATHQGSTMELRPVSQSYLAKPGQVLGIQEELWLSAEKGKGEDLLLPSRRAPCTGPVIVVFILKSTISIHTDPGLQI